MPVLTSARCQFRVAAGPDDADRADFARLYAEVATMDDFVWVYRGEEILRDLWAGNAGHFVETARGPDGRLVGYACAHPLAADVEPNVHGWVREHELPFSADEAVCLSSLGVRPDVRRGGIAMSLGYDALRWASKRGFRHFVLQANVEIARRRMGLAERLGARTTARFLDAREDTNRIVLLYGDVRAALAGDECSH